MNKKVRVGIVGLGDHCSKSHIEYLRNMPDICKIVALCDLDHHKVEEVQKTIDDTKEIQYYSDYKQMVNSADIDAVFIMTPDKVHTTQLVAAVEAGKHVFCEKPLATTIEEYEQLFFALGETYRKKLIVTTCHPRRFDPPFDILKNFIIENYADMGEILNFEFYFQYHKPSKQGLHTSLMFDHLNHEVDAMNYLFGFSKIKHAVKHYDSETAFHVSGLRKDGKSFSFIGQRKLEESIYPEYMKVNFKTGFITMDLHRGIFHIDEGSSHSTQQYESCKTNYKTRFEAINRNFLESIRGNAEPYITTDEMLMNTELAIHLHSKTFVEYN